MGTITQSSPVIIQNICHSCYLKYHVKGHISVVNHFLFSERTNLHTILKRLDGILDNLIEDNRRSRSEDTGSFAQFNFEPLKLLICQISRKSHLN